MQAANFFSSATTPSAIGQSAIAYAIVPCVRGRLLLAATRRGVCHVRLGERDDELENDLRREFPFAELEESAAALEAWTEPLRRYADGHAPRPELPFDVPLSRVQRRIHDTLGRLAAALAPSPAWALAE